MSEDIVRRILEFTSRPKEKVSGVSLIQEGNAVLEECDVLEAQIVDAMHSLRECRTLAAEMIAAGRKLL